MEIKHQPTARIIISGRINYNLLDVVAEFTYMTHLPSLALTMNYNFRWKIENILVKAFGRQILSVFC